MSIRRFLRPEAIRMDLRTRLMPEDGPPPDFDPMSERYLNRIRDGVIEVRPGIGTVVSTARRASAAERRALLSREVEQLAVEAKRLGLKQSEVVNAVRSRWTELFGDDNDE